MEHWIRNLVVGKNRYIESYGQYKRVMLSGKLALLIALLYLGYIAYDIPTGNYHTLPVLTGAILLLAISITLHRYDDSKAANYCLLTTINISTYLIAASESPNAGTFVLFIVSTIAAFTLFPYKERLESIFFAVFTYTLFVSAYFLDFSLLPERVYPTDSLVYFILINFSVALPAVVMVVRLMTSVQHNSMMKLVENTNLLMKTNSELDRFVYSTSHDLRAPLTSVMGLINITEQSREPEEVHRYLGMMRERVLALDHFIRDITDYSRNNRLEVTREKVFIREIVNEVWESLKFSPDAETIIFQNEIPDVLFLEVDRSRLQVVLGNLISNAVRYQDPDKTLRYILVQHYISGNIFHLKIADNGQGIPKELQTKVFDMFFRANERSKGSGLGLYIVREAMIKLSGSIQLDSEPLLGTTITLRLPI